MISKRRAILATLALACAGGPLATAATATAGWRVAFDSGGAYTLHSTATKCGSAKLGTYRLVTEGNLRGKTLHGRGTVSLLQDGRYHSFHITSVGGTLFTGLPPEAQTAVRLTLATTTIKVIRVRGNVLTTSFRLGGGAPRTGHVTLRHIRSC